MFRRFLLHKAIEDKGLLLILPKPPLFPRLLLGTFVGNVNDDVFSYGELPAFNPGLPQCGGSLVGGASRTPPGPFRGDRGDPAGDFLGPAMPTRGKRERFRASVPPG